MLIKKKFGKKIKHFFVITKKMALFSEKMDKKKFKKVKKNEKNAIFFVTYFFKNEYKIIFLYYIRVTK